MATMYKNKIIHLTRRDKREMRQLFYAKWRIHYKYNVRKLKRKLEHIFNS